MVESIVRFLIIVFTGHAIYKAYLKLTTRWCQSQVCLLGKTAIVTGANTGIGFQTALDFAKRGARVILACRDQEKGEEACDRIVKATGNQNCFVKIINMESFDSVRKFARDINATENRLDILVNNAGALGLGNKKSVDGHDVLLQVNYFSSFLLTNLLIDLLKSTTSSRIINVASDLAKFTPKTVDITEIDRFVSNYYNYCLSKLCNILFTTELSKKLEGSNTTTYSLHPGYIRTEITRHNTNNYKIFWFHLIVSLYGKTLEEGAQTTIYCSVTKGIEKYSGSFFKDCQKASINKLLADPNASKKLWKLSETIVDLVSVENRKSAN